MPSILEAPASQAQKHPPVPVRVLECAALAFAYFLTARVGQALAIPPGNVTSVWIPSGLVLAALLLRGRYLWPGIFVGAMAGNMWAYFDPSTFGGATASLFAGLMNGLGDALGSVLGATYILRASPGLNPFSRMKGVLTFLGAGVAVSSAVSAIFGVASLALAGFVPLPEISRTMVTWFFGDAVGVLLLTPPILVWARPRSPRPRLNAEAAAFLVVLPIIAARTLGLLPIGQDLPLPLFVLTPLFMWAVFRFDARIAFPAIVGVAAMGIVATIQQSGPFTDGDLPNALLSLQLFLAVMATTVLVFHTLTEERQADKAAVDLLNRELEARVLARTRELQGELEAREAAEAAQLQLERQVLHAQKLESLGVLAGGIAHDYNNMLTVIMASAELALLGMEEQDRARRHVHEILEVSHRSAALTHQMLAYSGRGAFQFQPIDLEAHLRAMRRILRLATSGHARPELKVKGALPLVHADPAQIDQLVMNLVLNAAEALGEEGGWIEISLQASQLAEEELQDAYVGARLAAGTWLSMRVRDNGRGMDPATLARIFDPFFTTKTTGRGLGMAVVLGIVRGHEGAIRVRSGVGEGTTFEILLPADPGADGLPG